MSEPTLFFSHSSKDKDMVLAIKNKVMQYTTVLLKSSGLVMARAFRLAPTGSTRCRKA